MIQVSITVRFFAQARELANLSSAQLKVPHNLYLSELRSIIAIKFNLSSIEDIFILAINEVYVTNNSKIILRNNDVVAVIPPISGGTKFIMNSFERFKNFNNWLIHF